MTSPPPPGVREMFDRKLVRARRTRAAKGFEGFDFLVRRCDEEFADRLASVAPARREGGFQRVLDLGSHPGSALRVLDGAPDINPSLLVHCGLSGHRIETGHNVVGSDELLPFADNSFDLILAPLTLHFVNDLPGALVQIRRCLRPGGLFLTSLFGGETLTELRAAFGRAEIEMEGGLSPRVIPFADIKDFGALLQRVNFSEPVADVDKVTVTYKGVRDLMRDLRGMGLANPMTERRKSPLKRATLAALERIYRDEFGIEEEIPASFHILFGTAWAPEEKTSGQDI